MGKKTRTREIIQISLDFFLPSETLILTQESPNKVRYWKQASWLDKNLYRLIELVIFFNERLLSPILISHTTWHIISGILIVFRVVSNQIQQITKIGNCIQFCFQNQIRNVTIRLPILFCDHFQLPIFQNEGLKVKECKIWAQKLRNYQIRTSLLYSTRLLFNTTWNPDKNRLQLHA